MTRSAWLGAALAVMLAPLAAGCRDRDDGRAAPAGGASAPMATAQPSTPPAATATSRPGGGAPATRGASPDDERGSGGGPATVDDEPVDEHTAACAPPDPTLKPMQLLRFRFTSAIAGREPGDKLFIARPGQRVYAHLTVRNRSGRDRCLGLEFRVGGQKRTSVTLKVGESWSWRTWAYNTLRPDDRGRLDLVVTDDQGKPFLSQPLPVVPLAR
jgi:hypothetical protein